MGRENKRKPNNDDPVFLRIVETMQRTNISQSMLCESIGVKPSAFTAWRYTNGRSYIRYIDKIAKCLHVTEEYLLNPTGRQPPKGGMAEEEILLLDQYRKLSSEKKRSLMDILHFYSLLQEHENEQEYDF